jgi:fructose-bisphosphate aldolase class I
MTAKGKGLLAADESTSTIGNRFKSINVENVEENRRAYRDLLFSVSKEASQYISGVILYEETLYQKDSNGVDFVKVLQDHGIVPGIKVDQGLAFIPGGNGEQYTEGLTGLAKRCQKYFAQGARFAKWRAVFNVDVAKNQPSEHAVRLNSDLLARYAAICQENGLVPIVEPEILVLEGSHNIEVSYEVTKRVLAAVYKALHDNHVVLERTILKPNMVLAGSKSTDKATPQQIAELTVRALRNTVPPAVPGIMFLSGGLSEEEAADYLNLINKVPGPSPWAISFSYGRALQHSALKAWKGSAENVKAGQEAYLQKANNCFLAAQGKL